jgi:hypothetical protein
LKTDQTIPQNSSKNNAQEHIERVLRTFFRPGEVFEICVIKPRGIESKWWQDRAVGKKPTVCGWFDDPAKAAEIAAKIDAAHKPEGIYFTLNPVNKALLARANNRLVAGMNRTTDKDIAVIRHVLIDVDPERPSGISSTDAELEAARVLVRRVVPEWAGLIALSGNGMHKILRLPDLPNTDETKAVIERFLKAANDFYRCRNTETDIALKVDTQVSNPARLTKLYGTGVRKGDDIPERPHRRSWVLHTPNPWPTVTLEYLAAWADEHAPETDPGTNAQERGTTGEADGGRLDVRRYLEAHGMEVVGTKRHGTATLYLLRHCVFNEGHTAKEAAIGQHDDGRLFYQCFHDSCRGRTWNEARVKISGDKPLKEYTEGGRPGWVQVSTTDEKEDQATLPPLPPWPVEAFFEPYARLILEVSESFAVPVEVAAAAFLSVAGACVGRTRTIYAGRNWFEPCILWLALVAATGLGKTPATGFLLKPIFNAEKRWWDQYRKDLARYEQALEDWKAQKKKERGPKPEPPSYEQLVVDDATTEALTDALDNNPRGILWNRDELSGLLLDLDRYAPVQGGSKARLLSAYDAGQWKVSRVAASRRALIPHAAVSIFGTIQPQVLSLVFAKTDLVSGFLPRFQMVFVERDRPPLWTEAQVSTQTFLAWTQTVDHLLALKFESEGNPGVVRLSVEAKKRFIEWHDKVACLPWTDPRGESLEPFLTKMRGRALRLVLLFHELACFLDKKPDCDTTVSLDTLERALLVADTFIAHQERALAHLSKVEIPGLPPLQRRIAEAIVSLADRIEGGVIPTAMVTEKVNEGADERFYVTAHSVGKGVKGLGLHTKLARYAGAPGRCVMVSPKDIARLKNLISPHANVTGVTAVTNQDAAMVSWRNTSEAKRYKCYTAPRGEEADPVTLVTLENGSVTPIEPHESRESNRCNVCNASEVEDENQTPEADDEVEVII